MVRLIVGDFYKLPHGIGQLLGKEVFNKEGNTIPIDTLDMTGTEFTRYIFQLNENSRWATLMESTRYAAWGQQIQEVPDERIN